MSFFEFPHTRTYDTDLGWLIKAVNLMKVTLDQFVSLNTIKYANPIQWDITTQYETNTVVIDPISGVAYISVQPVPSGVNISNTDYWTVIFDLGAFVIRASKNFTNHFESESTLTATFPSNVGDWLVWGDILYEVISPIIAGDQYVEGSNIKHITMEEVVDTLTQVIDDIDIKVGDLNNLQTSDISSIVNAINSVLSDLDVKIGDLANLTTTDQSSVVNAINEVNQNVIDIPTTMKYLLAGGYNHEPIPEILAEYIVDYEALIGTRPFNQGGCSDDDYFYQFLVDSTDTYSWVYKIDKVSGAITKIQLSATTHYNDATVVGNYILAVDGTTLTIFNKANLSILYVVSIVSSYSIAKVDDSHVVTCDGINLYLYDVSDVATPVLESTTALQSAFLMQALAGSVYANGVLLLAGWTASNQSSIIYAYELNGNLITTLTLPTNDTELESIDYDNEQIILSYQRVWNQALCSCVFKTIDLYNLQREVSALDEGDSYGVGTYNVYCDSTYTGFYVDGTSAKPFVTINACAQFIERIIANEKIIWLTGTHGYVTFSKTGDNIIVRGTGTLKRITAYCKSLQLINVTVDASSYAGEAVFARNCNLILNNATFIAQSTYHCINTAYGQVFITNTATFSGGDYGLYAQYCSMYFGASLVDGGVVNNLLYLANCQVVTLNPFDYTRSGSNLIINGSFNPEDFSVTINSAIASGSYIDVTFTFTRYRMYSPRVFVTVRDNDKHNLSAVVTGVTATVVNVRIYNNDSAATTSGHVFLYGIAIGI